MYMYLLSNVTRYVRVDLYVITVNRMLSLREVVLVILFYAITGNEILSHRFSIALLNIQIGGPQSALAEVTVYFLYHNYIHQHLCDKFL